MAYPTTVPTVATGDVFTEGMWNTYVAENVNGLLSPAVCIVKQNAGTQQQLTSSTDTAITMEAAEANPDGLWSASVNPSRITVAQSGVYMVTGVAQIAQVVDASEGAYLGVWKNGAASIFTTSLFPEGNALFSCKGFMVLAANDYVQLYARSYGFGCPVSAARLGVVWISRTS